MNITTTGYLLFLFMGVVLLYFSHKAQVEMADRTEFCICVLGQYTRNRVCCHDKRDYIPGGEEDRRGGGKEKETGFDFGHDVLSGGFGDFKVCFRIAGILKAD